jgi:hypothetical protein
MHRDTRTGLHRYGTASCRRKPAGPYRVAKDTAPYRCKNNLGIQGKLSLWHALQVVSALDARLRGLDFEELISRAEAQYSKVEEQRLLLAAEALKQEQA